MKLLVVIPTWNRADCLDKAIQAISEARFQTQKCTVELFISDNCSSDHTSDVTSKWQQRAPWIHVRRWETHTSHWGEILERAEHRSDDDGGQSLPGFRCDECLSYL